MAPSTCASTGSLQWSKQFSGRTITLQPGSPCNDFRGYCDVFMRCRLVDADGPLARLKKAIFSPQLYENIAEWIVVSIVFIHKNLNLKCLGLILLGQWSPMLEEEHLPIYIRVTVCIVTLVLISFCSDCVLHLIII